MTQIQVPSLEKQVMFSIQDELDGGCTVHLYRYATDKMYDHYMEKRFPERIVNIYMEYGSDGSDMIMLTDRDMEPLYRVVCGTEYTLQKNLNYQKRGECGEFLMERFDKGKNVKDCPFWDNLWVSLQDEYGPAGRIQ